MRGFSSAKSLKQQKLRFTNTECEFCKLKTNVEWKVVVEVWSSGGSAKLAEVNSPSCLTSF